MTISKEEGFLSDAIGSAARELCLAARTAPKTRGVDLIETAVVDGDDLKSIISEMEKIFASTQREAFRKNAGSLKNCTCAVLIGAKNKTAGLAPCGLCGFKDCDDNEKSGAVCAFNMMDLGIAIGSAISVAADKRIDNRLMWTIGMAAKNLGVFGKEVKQIIGIPLSATGKNIFFDRK
jgi:uncharacterized ferredoxin-like protein